MKRLTLVLLSLFALSTACSSDKASDPHSQADAGSDAADQDTAADLPAPTPIRIATYNTSLYRTEAGGLTTALTEGDPQAQQVADVLKHIRPDVVLLNEFDWDSTGASAQVFADNYLNAGDNPLSLGHHFVPGTNTGLHAGVDLDGNGRVVDAMGSRDYGGDAFGYGTFHGQYGMVVFSRFPIAKDAARTFQTLLWADMPNALLPTDYYSEEAQAIFRLSSKNHIDVPVQLDGATFHVLGCHPTPPSFDGDEDRNGRRNHDEIRFWSDYLTGGDAASYIKDDTGTQGGLAADAFFMIAGDLNSDPVDGDSRREAIVSLLGHPRVQDTQPASEGGTAAAARDGRANTQHEGDPKLDTADFSDNVVGNLRIDYALPSANTRIVDSGVFWPVPEDSDAPLLEASDHRLVWVDLEITPAE